MLIDGNLILILMLFILFLLLALLINIPIWLTIVYLMLKPYRENGLELIKEQTIENFIKKNSKKEDISDVPISTPKIETSFSDKRIGKFESK